MAIYNGRLSQLDPAEVRRYAGLQDAQAFPADYVRQACQDVQILAEPQGVYHVYAYDAATATIQCEVPLRLEGRAIARHLQYAEKVYVMAVTIGEEVERKSTKLFAEGAYTLGLLVDAAATTAVEEVANQLNEWICREARRQGYMTTWRFSPGYGDWPLTAQAGVANCAGAAQIGLSVTETHMLFPRKSITAIIGCMREGDVGGHSGCRSCGFTDCAYRKNI